MNDNNDQYVINPAEDVAFLLTYQNDSVDTLYVFRGQLDRLEESLWREQELRLLTKRTSLVCLFGLEDGEISMLMILTTTSFWSVLLCNLTSSNMQRSFAVKT